jgi:4-hydroxy-tetrahydrodipicolinate synthase
MGTLDVRRISAATKGILLRSECATLSKGGRKTARIRELEDGLDIDIFGGLRGGCLLEELIAGATGAMTGSAFPRLRSRSSRSGTTAWRASSADFFYPHVPIRRLRKNPAIAGYVFKAVFQR